MRATALAAWPSSVAALANWALVAARGTTHRRVPTTATTIPIVRACGSAELRASFENPTRPNTKPPASWIAKKLVAKSRSAPYRQLRRAQRKSGARHAQRRHQGDRDRDTRKDLRQVLSDHCNRSRCSGCQRHDKIDDTRCRSGSHLSVSHEVHAAGRQMRHRRRHRYHRAGTEHREQQGAHAFRPSPVIVLRAIASIGVISGAIIIAPTTTAAESATMPPVAITEDRASITKNLEYLSRTAPRS